MKADESILQRLDAATKAPYWPVGVDGIYYYLRIIFDSFWFCAWLASRTSALHPLVEVKANSSVV